MINKPNTEKKKEKTINRYELSNTVVRRARQLVDGDSSLVKTKEKSAVTIALIELKEDKLKVVRD